jgi:ubiquinone biosynthesis protein COQ9
MMAPPERSPERDAAIEAMLPHVPFDGWTKRTLRLGLANAGMPADEAELLFPGGASDMVAVFCDLADRRMEEAVRRALAVLALPGRTRVAAACTARTVDAVWRAAGDRSADFSWYTKRAILTAVYGAALLFWLSDASEDQSATLAFIDRRLASVGRIGRARRGIESRLGRLVPRLPTRSA